jgi:rhodanese-related sulfurtransferase
MFNFLKKLFGPGTDYKGLVQQGAVIVDVRSENEFKSGHIKGAINIPLNNIQSKVKDLKKKGKPVITCCASGMRSGSAVSILKMEGIEVYNGGGWTSLNSKLN